MTREGQGGGFVRYDCQKKLDIIKQHDDGISVMVLVAIDMHKATPLGKAICIEASGKDCTANGRVQLMGSLKGPSFRDIPS